MANEQATQSLTTKPITPEVIEEDGKVVAVHRNTVVTDPNDPDAVIVLDPEEYPTANAQTQDPLRAQLAGSPNDALDPDEASVNEVQRLAHTGTVSGGTFKIVLPASLGGETTAAINYNETPANIAAAVVEALGDRGHNGEGLANVTGSGATPSSGNCDLTFVNDLGAEDIDALTVDGALLTGSTPVITVAEQTKGIHSDD